MRRLGAIVLMVAALLLVPAAPSHAQSGHGGWHGGWYGGVFIGSPWWWGPLYPYPYWYYPQPYYAYSPVVIQEPPSMYIQQEPAPSAAPPQAYWYYCASAKAYYPKVQKCPEAWIKVPPPPQ
jgi:hypothetical protein